MDLLFFLEFVAIKQYARLFLGGFWRFVFCLNTLEQVFACRLRYLWKMVRDAQIRVNQGMPPGQPVILFGVGFLFVCFFFFLVLRIFM